MFLLCLTEPPYIIAFCLWLSSTWLVKKEDWKGPCGSLSAILSNFRWLCCRYKFRVLNGPEFVPLHTCLPNVLNLPGKEMFNPKDPWLSVWLRLAIKKHDVGHYDKSNAGQQLQNTNLRSFWGFMDWMLQKKGSTGRSWWNGGGNSFQWLLIIPACSSFMTAGLREH